MLDRALGFALLFAIACGPSPRQGNGDDNPGGDGGGGSGNPNGDSCSSDLHNIVDVNGNVVMTCASDQGCSNGYCIAACDAAAASNGSVGCDFQVATPSFYATILPPCFAVFIANNWPANVTMTIDRGGVTYDATVIGRVPNGTPNAAAWPAVGSSGLASSSVAVLFLSSDPASQNGTTGTLPMTCPVTPGVNTSYGSAVFAGPGTAQTGFGKSFHIKTSLPVSAYDILPYGGASSFLPSAELLLPTTAWGTNYVAAAPTESPALGPYGQTVGPGWGQVVASQDATTISISPTTALPSGTGITSAPPNTPSTYTLNAGEYIQWQDAGDMSGSIISSNNPVSFTGGTGYLCQSSATSSGGGCDSAHQLIPPVSALGSEYVAPPYATRRLDLQDESIKYRIVGAAAGTQLVYAPAVSAAPATIGVGQVVDFEATGPFTITSQDTTHPFYVAQYMSGCNTTSGSRAGAGGGCLGDEEFVNILPPAQWLSSYVFFTDPTYTTTNLVIVRRATGSGFQDVTVDCLGTISGWKPVAGGSEYEITNVDLQRDTPVGTCTNGRHTASSSGAFNVMVWGLANEASYAYPAGGNVGKINPVVVIF